MCDIGKGKYRKDVIKKRNKNWLQRPVNNVWTQHNSDAQSVSTSYILYPSKIARTCKVGSVTIRKACNMVGTYQYSMSLTV